MFASVRAALSQQPGPRIITAASPSSAPGCDPSTRIAPCGSLRLPFRGVGVGAPPRLPLPQLVGLGANAVRTWGVDQLDEPFLRECAAHGVAVFAGVWINSSADGDAGVAAATAAVRRWGSLPVGEAIAAWIVGNEVELREANAGGGGQAAAWKYIARVAAAVRASDPLGRPLATALADVGGGKAAAAAASAGVDFLLINAYGGASSLPERLAEQGFNGAYALGEYGPCGQWEAPNFCFQPPPPPSLLSPRHLVGQAQALPSQATMGSPRSQSRGGFRLGLGRALGGLGGLGAAFSGRLGSIAARAGAGLGAPAGNESFFDSRSGSGALRLPGQGLKQGMVVRVAIAMEQSSGQKAAASLQAYAANLNRAPVTVTAGTTIGSSSVSAPPLSLPPRAIRGGTAGAVAVWRALAAAAAAAADAPAQAGGTCIGAFLFFGGAKTEAGATGTWYSLLLTPAAARCAHWTAPRPVADRLAVHWLLWRATPPGAAAASGLSTSSGYTPRHSGVGSGSAPGISIGDVLMRGAGSDAQAAAAAICALAKVPCALGITVEPAPGPGTGAASGADASSSTCFTAGSRLRATVQLPAGALPASTSGSGTSLAGGSGICECDWTLERLQGEGPSQAASGPPGGAGLGALGATLALGSSLLQTGGGAGAASGARSRSGDQPPLVATFQRMPGISLELAAPAASASLTAGPAIYRLTAFLRYTGSTAASSSAGSSSAAVASVFPQAQAQAEPPPFPHPHSAHPVVEWFAARPDALAALVRDCAWLARDGVATASALFAVV